MAKSKAIEQYDKCSTLLKRFLSDEIIHKEITNFFNDKTVSVLIEHEIYVLDRLLIYTGKGVRLMFQKSEDFRTLSNDVAKICSKEIPIEYKQYKRGNKYILIEAFDLLSEIIKHYGNYKIDYHYIDYRGVEIAFELAGIKTYRDIYNYGITGLSKLPRFGKKGYEELVYLLRGVNETLETGIIKHTPKWISKENKKKKEIKPKKVVKNSRKKRTGKKTKETKTIKPFSLYGLASGKPGRKFTIKEFLAITKNAKKKPGGPNTDKTIKLSDGYIYEADSKQEIATLKKLISHDAFKRLRGQCINIPYKYNGDMHNYYPDFIVLTQTNKIIIMEVKEIAQMNTKQNIRKYKALSEYCEKHGYLYIMCDKKFKPFERLSKLTVNRGVREAIDDAIEEKGYFNYSDFKELIAGKDYKKVTYIRDSIGIYVKSHKNLKMVGDLTFKSADFRITKIRKK